MKVPNRQEIKEIHDAANSVCGVEEKLVKKLIELKGHLLCYYPSEVTRTQQEIELLCSELERVKLTFSQVFTKNFGELTKENVTLISEQDAKMNGIFLKMRSLRKEFKEHKIIVDHTVNETREFMFSKFQEIVKTKEGSDMPNKKKSVLYKRKGLLK